MLFFHSDILDKMLPKILSKIKRYFPSVKPINLLVTTLLSTCILWFYTFLPITTLNSEMMMPLIINESDQSMCYNNFVWNDANKHLRFKYILDDDVLEKSNGKNIFFHLTNCLHDGIVEVNAR